MGGVPCGIAPQICRRSAVQQVKRPVDRLVHLAWEKRLGQKTERLCRFGFRRVPPGRLAMPGPVDPARFLALELEDGALADANGAVLPLKP